MMKSLSRKIILGIACWLALGGSAQGQTALGYGTIGSTYSQNFDSLPNTGTFTLGAGANAIYDFANAPFTSPTTTGMAGWGFQNTASNARFTVDDGNGNTGSVYSYGTTSATDRALGLLASSTNISRFGLVLVNNTGSTLDSFTITFTAEQWHRGSSTAETLTFAYAVGAAVTLNTGTFVNVTSLNAPSTGTGAQNSATDGNNATNRIAGITATVTGVNWQAGQQLVIRWSDTNDTGNDDGISVDDFSFSATIPETSTWVTGFLAVGALSATLWRRKAARSIPT